MSILCTYQREGIVSGHWCNECPPLNEYASIDRKEVAQLAAINKKLREKASRSKNVKY
jgi:hypothetical protein